MLPILPPAPSRTDPSNFSSKADAWVDALDAWTDAANALEQSLQLVATTGTSTSSLPIGTGSKGLTTQTGKVWAVGSWVYIASASSITNLMQGQITAYNSGTGNLVVNVTQSTGSGTFTDWIIALASPTTNSANLSGGAAGSIPYQSGVNTTSFLAAGSTGQLLSSNGSSAPSWISVDLSGRLIGVQTFTANATYTKTPGTSSFIFEIIGGGGASGGTAATGASQISFGGHGGSGCRVLIRSIGYDWNGSTLTVGAGGTASGTVGQSGNAGGYSEISKSSYNLRAEGGTGGPVSSASSTFPQVAGNGTGGAYTGTEPPNTTFLEQIQLSSESCAASSVGFVFLPGAPGVFTKGASKWSTSLGSGVYLTGNSCLDPGAGGRMAVSGPSSSGQLGVNGLPGLIRIYEYA